MNLHNISPYFSKGIVAILILIVGIMVTKFIKNKAHIFFNKFPNIDKSIEKFIIQFIYYTGILITILAALAQMGVQTTSIMAVLGTLGLAIGLALQGTLSNVASGIMILVLRPFNVGEYIQASEVSGTVKEIGLFISTLQTPEGVHVVVPNSQIFNKTIKNYTRIPNRRLELTIGIDYQDDYNKAMELLKQMANEHENVLKDQNIEVCIIAHAESSINIRLRCWTTNEQYWALVYEFNKTVLDLFAQNQISIPYPQLQLSNRSNS